MKKSKAKVILLVALTLFFICYVVFQLVSSFGGSVKTEMAIYSTYTDVIKTKSFVVKSESVLADTGDDEIVKYMVANGERISQGTVVAEGYSNIEQVDACVKATELEKKIQQYEKLVSIGGNFSGEVDKLQTRVNDKIFLYLDSAENGGLKNISKRTDDLLEIMNETQLATGDISTLSSKIEEMKIEKANYDLLSGEPMSEIIADQSGYYVNSTDSLENLYDLKKISEITCEDVDGLLNSTPQENTNTSGKIITGLEWYFVCNVDATTAAQFKINSSISIGIPDVFTEKIPVVVKALNYNAANDKCAVVLECNYMNSTLSSLRNEDIEIYVNTYSGLRVPTEAIRVIDGVTGVYVQSGITAKFKAIDILYKEDRFTICKLDNTNSSSLSTYEEVIVSGSDLYDGKVIK